MSAKRSNSQLLQHFGRVFARMSVKDHSTIDGFKSTSTSQLQSDPLASHLFQTANNYLFGINGFSQDVKTAINYLRQAASQGHAQAEGVLGFCYEFGLGNTTTDFRQAEHHYIRAARQED
jgi:TPR repeat protein